MSMSFEDPLAIKVPGDTQQPLSDSTSYSFTSVNDANENVVQSKSGHEKILEPEKVFDFLVCNHESNNEQASRIYEEMEKLRLQGYIYERDKIVGQYKLTAYEQAIRNTESIILLISTEALRCGEFSRKMHASSNFSVIPIYIDLPRKEYPRLLRHHVGIKYTNDDDFWERLRIAITRPMKDCESSTEKPKTPTPFKKEPVSQASPSPRNSKKPIKVVPQLGRSVAPEKQYKKPPPSSKSKPEKKWWSFRSKQNREKEMPPAIQMKTIRTKGKALDDEASNR